MTKASWKKYRYIHPCRRWPLHPAPLGATMSSSTSASANPAGTVTPSIVTDAFVPPILSVSEPQPSPISAIPPAFLSPNQPAAGDCLQPPQPSYFAPGMVDTAVLKTELPAKDKDSASFVVSTAGVVKRVTPASPMTSPIVPSIGQSPVSTKETLPLLLSPPPGRAKKPPQVVKSRGETIQIERPLVTGPGVIINPLLASAGDSIRARGMMAENQLGSTLIPQGNVMASSPNGQVLMETPHATMTSPPQLRGGNYRPQAYPPANMMSGDTDLYQPTMNPYGVGPATYHPGMGLTSYPTLGPSPSRPVTVPHQSPIPTSSISSRPNPPPVATAPHQLNSVTSQTNAFTVLGLPTSSTATLPSPSSESGHLVPVTQQDMTSTIQAPTQWRVVPTTIAPTTLATADEVANQVSSLMKKKDTSGSVMATLSGHELAKLLATTPSLQFAQGDQETNAALARLSASLASVMSPQGEGLESQADEVPTQEKTERITLPPTSSPRVVSTSSADKAAEPITGISSVSSVITPMSSCTATPKSTATSIAPSYGYRTQPIVSTPSTSATTVTHSRPTASIIKASATDKQDPTSTIATSQTKVVYIDVVNSTTPPIPVIMAPVNETTSAGPNTSINRPLSSPAPTGTSLLTSMADRTTSASMSPTTATSSAPAKATVIEVPVAVSPVTSFSGSTPNCVIVKTLNSSCATVVSRTHPGSIVNKSVFTLHIKTE